MYSKILTSKLHRRINKTRLSTVQQNLSNLGFFGLLAGRDLYRATPAVTRELGFKVSSEGPMHLSPCTTNREKGEPMYSIGNACILYIIPVLYNIFEAL